MKLQFLIPVLFLFLQLTGLRAEEAPHPAALNALIAADKTRVEAMQSGDERQLGTVLSDALHYAHSTGFVDSKQSLMDTLRTKKTRYLEYIYEERNFTFPSPDIALMTGRAHVKVEAGGALLDNVLSFLAVWRQEQSGWRFLAWQSCKLPPATK